MVENYEAFQDSTIIGNLNALVAIFIVVELLFNTSKQNLSTYQSYVPTHLAF